MEILAYTSAPASIEVIACVLGGIGWTVSYIIKSKDEEDFYNRLADATDAAFYRNFQRLNPDKI